MTSNLEPIKKVAENAAKAAQTAMRNEPPAPSIPYSTEAPPKASGESGKKKSITKDG